MDESLLSERSPEVHMQPELLKIARGALREVPPIGDAGQHLRGSKGRGRLLAAVPHFGPGIAGRES